MRFCEKCSRMIQPDEEYRSHDKFSSSGGGITVHLHAVCPPKTGQSAR